MLHLTSISYWWYITYLWTIKMLCDTRIHPTVIMWCITLKFNTCFRLMIRAGQGSVLWIYCVFWQDTAKTSHVWQLFAKLNEYNCMYGRGDPPSLTWVYWLCVRMSQRRGWTPTPAASCGTWSRASSQTAAPSSSHHTGTPASLYHIYVPMFKRLVVSLVMEFFKTC